MYSCISTVASTCVLVDVISAGGLVQARHRKTLIEVCEKMRITHNNTLSTNDPILRSNTAGDTDNGDEMADPYRVSTSIPYRVFT